MPEKSSSAIADAVLGLPQFHQSPFKEPRFLLLREKAVINSGGGGGSRAPSNRTGGPGENDFGGIGEKEEQGGRLIVAEIVSPSKPASSGSNTSQIPQKMAPESDPARSNTAGARQNSTTSNVMDDDAAPSRGRTSESPKSIKRKKKTRGAARQSQELDPDLLALKYLYGLMILFLGESIFSGHCSRLVH